METMLDDDGFVVGLVGADAAVEEVQHFQSPAKRGSSH